MKLCKYCKKPGNYDKLLGKVLCQEHRDVYLNFRCIWQAISELQFCTKIQDGIIARNR